MAYSVHTSYNTALVSLTRFDPQPRCAGLQYTRTSPLGSRAVWNEGPFFVLLWDAVEDATQLVTILTPCGLASAELAEVTVTGPDARFSIVRYNALVSLPTDVQRQNFFIRNLGLVFTDLIQI